MDEALIALCVHVFLTVSSYLKNKSGAYKFAVKRLLPALSRRFSKISWCRSRLREGFVSDKNVRAREILRSLLVPPASFRAL